MAIPSWYQATIPTTISAPTKIIKDIQHIMVSTIIGSTIQTNTLHASSLSSSTIQTNSLSITTLLGNTIQTNTSNVSTIEASTIQTNVLSFTTLYGSTIQANALQYNTIIGCTIQTNTQDSKIIIGSSIQTNALNVSSLIGSSIQTNTTIASSLINGVILTPVLYMSSLLGSSIHTKVVNASTLASDSIQLNNLYVSTLAGSTIIGNSCKINASNISSTAGSTIQTNILQTNTLAGSTIQTDSFIVSTINITGTNVIPMNTLNVTVVKASTIICSTIQTNQMGDYGKIVQLAGEYITFDLGTGGNYHNQYRQMWNSVMSVLNKIHFVGSNDGITWTNLGISTPIIFENMHIFSYTLTNLRYIRLIFIEIVSGTSLINSQYLFFGLFTITYNGGTNLINYIFGRGISPISQNITEFDRWAYTDSFQIGLDSTYSVSIYPAIGYYTGSIHTEIFDINAISDISLLIASTIQTNSLYGTTLTYSTIQANTLQVSTLSGSTFINTTIQSNTLDVSSLIGGTIQMNTISGNTIAVSSIQTNQIGTSTISGSTILMNRLDTSTIIGSSIQTSQIGVSTITHNTIQMNTLIGNMNVRAPTGNAPSNVLGEYITFDLGTSGLYHNQYVYQNTGSANPYKIHFLGSDDGITWTSLGVSTSTDDNGAPGTGNYNYTSTNKRYLRLVIIEVYHQNPNINYTYIYVVYPSINYIDVANPNNNAQMTINDITYSAGLSVYTPYPYFSIADIYITCYTYKPPSYGIIGSYDGSVSTNISTIIYDNTFANTIIGSTIQSDTFVGGALQISTMTGSIIIGNTIQTPQLNISTILGSTIIASNLQANKFLITDGNKALSTSATSATQLGYIDNMTSYAGGIGQSNTWTSTNTFTIAPIFTGLSTSAVLYTLAITSGNQLVTYNQGSQSMTGTLLANYTPYASAVSTLTSSIIYRVNATDIAIGQTTSTFPTGTGTTFSIVGLLQTTNLTATSGTFSKIVMADKRSGLNGTVIPGNQGCNFYIGTMGNNGTGNLSDVLYLNSWSDSSAGNINAVMFNKHDIGMRIYQGAVGATSTFTTYRDPVMTDANSGNITLGSGSNTDGITFGPNVTWSSYLKMGAGPNRTYGGGIAQCYVNNGDLYLESGSGNDIYINSYSHTTGGGACTTEMYGAIKMNNLTEQTDLYAYPLVLSSNRLCRSQALTRQVYQANSVGWTGGVVLDYAFYKYNSHVPVNISGKLSYYMSATTRAYPYIRLYSQSYGNYYYFSLEAFTNNTYNHVTQFFELVLTSSDLPLDGWYQIYVYNAGNCISDGNDQLYVNVTILPASDY